MDAALSGDRSRTTRVKVPLGCFEISPFVYTTSKVPSFPRAQVNTDYFSGSCESDFDAPATSTDCMQPCH